MRHDQLSDAGRETPSVEHLVALVDFCAWCIKADMLPNITMLEQVKGHRDYAATVCPGWIEGGWRGEFYTRLEEAL